MKKILISLVMALCLLCPTCLRGDSQTPLEKIVLGEIQKPKEYAALKTQTIIDKGAVDHYVYTYEMDKDIMEPLDYRELIVTIRNASAKDIVILNINCDGGSVGIGNSIISALLQTKAHTVANVDQAMSMAQMIAMSCKEINVKPTSMMMVHFFSVMMEPGLVNVGALRNTLNARAQQFEILLRAVNTGFLTEQEFQIIFHGAEVFINGPDIQKRLKNRVIRK